MKLKTKLLIVLAVVLALLILFLIFRALVENGLGRRIAETNALFENGTGGQPGIAAELQARLDAADELQNIAAKYDEAYTEYSALRSTIIEMKELLKAYRETGSADLGRLYDLNALLSTQFITCREALEPITEGKAHNALGDYQTAMDEAQAVIDRSGYNRAVSTFYDTVLDRFPNSLLKGLVKEAAPALWQSGGGL